MANIVAIIPARGGSVGIPRKNVIDFCEKPLIAWSIEQARASKNISKVYVTTDNQEIADTSKKFGADIVWRPADLATGTSPSEAAILHALGEIEKNGSVDLVVFLQATSPLRETADIDGCIARLGEEKADSLFSMSLLDDFCIWDEQGGALRSVTYDYQNRGMRQNRKPCFLENGSIYVFKPEILRKHNNRLGGKIALYAMAYWKSYEIDCIEGMKVCEYYMRSKLLSQNIAGKPSK